MPKTSVRKRPATEPDSLAGPTTPKANSAPVFLPPREVMSMLSISRTTLNAMSKDGRLPSPICFGSRMPRWNAEELASHLRNLSTKTLGTL